MGEVKHTPGPWVVTLDMREDLGEEYLAGYDIHGAEGVEIIGCEGIRPGGYAEMDARLIAAAPDILEALTSIVYAYGANSAEPEKAFKAITAHIGKAAAAIAKAEASPNA